MGAWPGEVGHEYRLVVLWCVDVEGICSVYVDRAPGRRSRGGGGGIGRPEGIGCVPGGASLLLALLLTLLTWLSYCCCCCSVAASCSGWRSAPAVLSRAYPSLAAGSQTMVEAAGVVLVMKERVARFQALAASCPYRSRGTGGEAGVFHAGRGEAIPGRGQTAQGGENLGKD